jgi:hypothetical protein
MNPTGPLSSVSPLSHTEEGLLLLLSHDEVEARGGVALLLLSHDGGRLTDVELGAAEGGSLAPSLELHVEEAAVATAQSPCGCRARSRHSPSLSTKTPGEMDSDEHNEVEETSSKQRERLLALCSTASATPTAAPPSPTRAPNLLPTVWRLSLSLSSG